MIHKIAILILAISAIASVGMQYTDADAHTWGGTRDEVRGLVLMLFSVTIVGLTGVLVLARVFSPNEISYKPSH